MKLSTISVKPASIDEPTFREMYRLKARHLRVRSDVGEQQDFTVFRKDCLKADIVVLARSEDDAVQGFYIIGEATVSSNERATQVITADYGVLNKAYRGDVGFLAEGLFFVLKRFARHPRRPKYFMAGAFPASYLLLRRFSNRCWTRRDPGLPLELLGVFTKAANALFGQAWDEHHGWVGTRVDPDPPSLSARVKCAEELEQYLAHNPAWMDGNALVVMIPIDLRTVVEIFRTGFERAMTQYATPEMPKSVTA